MSQLETGEEKESLRVAMSPVPNEQVPIGVAEHEQGLMCRKGATPIHRLPRVTGQKRRVGERTRVERTCRYTELSATRRICAVILCKATSRAIATVVPHF